MNWDYDRDVVAGGDTYGKFRQWKNIKEKGDSEDVAVKS